MKYDKASLLLNLVTFDCLLCKEKFRNKINLRGHFQSNHTDYECDRFIESRI